MVFLYTSASFLLFLFSSLAYIIVARDRLSEIFTNGITRVSDVIDNDYNYVMLLVFLSFYPIYVVCAAIYNVYVEFNISFIDIYFTTATLLTGIAFAVLLAPIWYSSISNKKYADYIGIMVIVTFAAMLNTYVVVGLNPDSEVIYEVYGKHVEISLTIIQAIASLAILPILQRMQQMATIFVNNLLVAVRSATFGLVGAITGVGTAIALVPLFTSSIIAGTVGGIVLRNNLDIFYAPLISIFAILGVPPVWHTFFEYRGFVLVSIGAGMLIYGYISSSGISRTGLASVVIGIAMIAIGAVSEVLFGSSVAYIMLQALDFTPKIAAIQVSPLYVLAVIETVLVVGIIGLLIVYMTQFVVYFIERMEVM